MENIVYTVDDIPKYTPWVNRILGIDPWSQKNRIPEGNSREFNIDKWGELYRWYSDNEYQNKINEVNEYWYRELDSTLMLERGKFDLEPVSIANTKYLDLVYKAIIKYSPVSSVLELGAGFGNIIINIAKKLGDNIGIYAAEYTSNGRSLIKNIASNNNIDIAVGSCDFMTGEINGISVPADSCIITSYASQYVPILDDKFIDSILKLRPKVVIQFEPVYEHCDDGSLFGLLRKRYIEINDYNTNLLTLLKNEEKKGTIYIIKERAIVFAVNPLLAISVVIWTPNYSREI